jgi:hypothetical protein
MLTRLAGEKSITDISHFLIRAHPPDPRHPRSIKLIGGFYANCHHRR